jgi:hypothetical protein
VIWLIGWGVGAASAGAADGAGTTRRRWYYW